MPVPEATRFGMNSDYMVRTPTFPFQSSGDPYEDYEMFGHLNDNPISGVSYRPASQSKFNSYDFSKQDLSAPVDYFDTLGGADMVETLPHISSRVRSVAPFYEHQVRSTPAPRSQSQVWGDVDENYHVDDSAGMPSRNFFRKSYSLPLTRSGRSGGQWRHIKQATGQTGSNLLFIEGTVKDHDVKHFPPYGILQPQIRYNKLGQRLLPGRQTSSSYGGRRTEVNSRAKKGFQYWYKEPKSNISRTNVGPIGGAKSFCAQKVPTKTTQSRNMFRL